MAKRQPITRQLTVADAVSEAFSVLEELGQEMRERFDNTPESLQQTDVSQRVEEAADALEGLAEPDVPASIADLELEFVTVPLKARASRSARRDEALEILHAVVDKLDSVLDSTGDGDLNSDKVDDASALRDEIDSLIGDAEAVEFPGMYG